MTSEPTILIVDDQAVGRRTLRALLVAHDYRLAFASDGPEALALAAELTPDLILLDVMMPGMDGFETCRRLRADPLTAEVPVIMVTALDDRESRVKGIESGADDFISKPFDTVELRARIKTITSLNRYRRLHLERSKFEWVIQHSDDGYLMVTSDGKLRYSNPQARIYLDLPADEEQPVSETFTELARKGYHLQPEGAWKIPLALSQPDYPRYLVRPDSPTARPLWLQVEMFNASLGSDGDWIIRLRDVTEQVGSKRDIRMFSTLIHHKMRTPLIGMVGGVEMLVRYWSQLSPEEIVASVEMTHRGVTNLHHAIEDILLYLDAPGLTQTDERLVLSQLQPMVTDISATLKLEAITVTCPPELLDTQILLAPRAAEMALWELLENAVKFHPSETPTVQVDVSQTADQKIRLSIRDDGVTVSPEHLGKIWTPFYQGEKDFTGQAKGMGLGLSLVASLIWAVGGATRAFNRIGGPGLVVELQIPILEKGTGQDDAQ